VNKVFAIYVIGIIFFSGCVSENPEEKRIKTVIAKYNIAVIEAYKNQYFDYLKESADEKEFRKIYVITIGFLQGNRILESELLSLAFKEIKIEDSVATVKTSEDWSYRWVDYRTREEVEPLKDLHYEMIYHLVKKDGRWLVEKAEEVK